MGRWPPPGMVLLAMRRPPQESIHVQAMLADEDLLSVDMQRLRDCFAQLCEKAANVLPSNGLDFDDVVYDRRLGLQLAGGVEQDVEAAFLAERDHLLKHVAGELGVKREELAAAAYRIVRLKVVVIRDLPFIPTS